jgi:hypothetical protein
MSLTSVSCIYFVLSKHFLTLGCVTNFHARASFCRRLALLFPRESSNKTISVLREQTGYELLNGMRSKKNFTPFSLFMACDLAQKLTQNPQPSFHHLNSCQHHHGAASNDASSDSSNGSDLLLFHRSHILPCSTTRPSSYCQECCHGCRRYYYLYRNTPCPRDKRYQQESLRWLRRATYRTGVGLPFGWGSI